MVAWDRELFNSDVNVNDQSMFTVNAFSFRCVDLQSGLTKARSQIEDLKCAKGNIELSFNIVLFVACTVVS